MNKPFLFATAIFRGYKRIDDFVKNENYLYVSKSYPLEGKYEDKYIYILANRFFEGGKKNSQMWQRFESDPLFDDKTFIYEDHEESVNLDYRWFEVMRKRKRGIYIPDQTPLFYRAGRISNASPVIVPGYFPLYDKYEGKPFSIYGFTDSKSKFRTRNIKRDIDVIFIGMGRDQRKQYMYKIIESAQKLKLKYIIGRGFSVERYIDLFLRSKLNYNFMGLGYRCGREWEALITGGLLINDDRTVDNMLLPGMELDKDFIKFDPENCTEQMKYWVENEEEREKISCHGFNTAWKIWSGCFDPYMPSRKDAGKALKEEGW